jgi:V8-like Glu-specific endopeptidase
MMRPQNRYKPVLAGIWFLSMCAAVYVPQSWAAQQQTPEGVVMKENTEVRTESSGGEAWTEERLRGAKPLDLPISKQRYSEQKKLEKTVAPQDRKAGDGKPPTVNVAPQAEGSAKKDTTSGDKLGKGDAASGDKENKGDIQVAKAEDEPLSPNLARGGTGETALGVIAADFGTQKAQFSSSRLVPESARLEYPYRTIGKLFFTEPGVGDFICSASVLRPRVILTAGHCVHKGSGGVGGFYANFLFIPAFEAGATPAPFQSWNWRFVVTTSTWATGNGGVPNAADYAIIELEERPFGGTPRKIGEVTGFLGWQTNSLDPNHTNKLGYPANFDGANQMHQVNSQHHRDIAPNNVEYGSDMRGGSSGGGWVQNFGIPAAGQTGGLNPGFNRLVGVTSYGYTAQDPKVQGSAILDNNFINILNAACNHKPGNC